MSDRIDRVEDQLREEVKEIKDILSKMQVSLAVLQSKQNIGAWIFNSLLTVTVLSISGWIIAHFSK